MLAPVKMNLAAMPNALASTHEPAGEVARIGWVGEVDLGAEDVLGSAGCRRKKNNAEQAADFIQDFLATGERESADLMAAMVAAGFSARAIKDGRREAGVRARLDGYGPEGRWMVRLPPQADEEVE